MYKSEVLSQAVLKSKHIIAFEHIPKEEFIGFDDWLELRDRCRKDLYWFATKILKLGWVEKIHREICDFFVQKNFDGCFPADYTLDDVHNAIRKQRKLEDVMEERMLLHARGFYKTYINGVDCVQWLLNCPDMRIFVITGEYDKAVDFLKMVKGYFYHPKEADLTLFQRLFPEYMLEGKDGTSEAPLECPAALHKQTGFSLWVNSVDSALSGWHCELMKGDDVVTNRNSQTPETRKKLKDNYDNIGNMLMPWSFRDHIGTRYFIDDWYGTRIAATTDDNPLRLMKRQAMYIKPGFESILYPELQEHMVDLAWPEHCSWKSIRKMILQNERDFRNQQMNEPLSDELAIHFTEDILRAAQEQHSAVPKLLPIYIAWDWAPSSNATSDYSCGSASVYDTETKQLHIIDVIFGRWKASELAFQIVNFAHKHNPKVILLERSTGIDLLKEYITQMAIKYHTQLPIVEMPTGNDRNAKGNRIKGLEVLLADGRLKFVIGPWIDEMISQFVRYTGEIKNRGRKDDIPDCVSMHQHFIPQKKEDKPTLVKTKEMLEEELKALHRAQMQAGYQQVFNTPSPIQTVPQLDTETKSAKPKSTRTSWQFRVPKRVEVPDLFEHRDI